MLISYLVQCTLAYCTLGGLVDSVMAGNKKAMITINGVTVERAECSSGMCILDIIR